MTDKDIVILIQRLFEPSVSPGTAFDVLFKLRQERVVWKDVYRAVTIAGKALQVRQHQIDEDEDTKGPKTFECPGCGVSRTIKAYCINPACPEYKPNLETERIAREHLASPPDFKNPKLSFGQYHGKTLLEVGVINPGYLTWLERDSQAEFWRQQARLAKIALAAQAPANRDTDDTGFFG